MFDCTRLAFDASASACNADEEAGRAARNAGASRAAGGARGGRGGMAASAALAAQGAARRVRPTACLPRSGAADRRLGVGAGVREGLAGRCPAGRAKEIGLI